MTDDDEIRILDDPDAKPTGIGSLIQAMMSVGNSVLDRMSEDQRAKIEAEVLAAFGLDDKDDKDD